MDSVRRLNVTRLGVVDYEAALKLQEAIVEARSRDQIADTLLILEHPHVFTLGRGADERFLLKRRSDVPVFRVSRGGQVTYHGPGQLVGYPILKLEGGARDVMVYLRALEQVVIGALAHFGLCTGRREGFTGVWVGKDKIASIGVGLRRWVTRHGFALNVAPDLSYFDAMIPCGIEGCSMTSVAALGHEATLSDVAERVEREFVRQFKYQSISVIQPASLWHLVDPGRTAGEISQVEE
ncbi:MAG: lipoyl(octanoyl) transferase LipB [Candidatus Binataceae bacterium]